MNRCDVCAQALGLGTKKVKVGWKEYCGPKGSECHRIGERNVSWSLSREDAAQLLNDLPDDMFDQAS